MKCEKMWNNNKLVGEDKNKKIKKISRHTRTELMPKWNFHVMICGEEINKMIKNITEIIWKNKII